MLVNFFSSSASTLPVSATENSNLKSKRDLSFAALEAWETYNREGEAHQRNESEGWLGVLVGTADYLLRSGKKTQLHDQAEKWRIERDLVCEIKGKILKNQAGTIREALEQIQQSGPEDLRGRASFYLNPEYRIYKGHPLGLLIDYASESPPSPETARQLLTRTFELEYESNGVHTAHHIYALIQRFSPQGDLQASSRDHLDALEGKSGFGRAVEKFVFSSSPESMAITVGTMGLAVASGARVAHKTAQALKAIGLGEKSAQGLGKTLGFFTEANVLWSANTLDKSALNDTETVFKSENLAKSYKANLVMLGATKGISFLGTSLMLPFAKNWGLLNNNALTSGGVALVGGTSHAFGIGSMLASTQINQALGYQEKPLGGANESLVHDIFGYASLALAHRWINGASGGKLNAWMHGPTRSEIMRPKKTTVGFSLKPLAKSLILKNPLTWMAMGMGIGGGGSSKKTATTDTKTQKMVGDLKNAPGDREILQVLADRLLEIGDPLGELLALDARCKIETDAAKKSLLEAELSDRQKNITARLRVKLERIGIPEIVDGGNQEIYTLSLRWRDGFIDSLTLDSLGSNDHLKSLPGLSMEILLKGPELRFLSGVTIIGLLGYSALTQLLDSLKKTNLSILEIPSSPIGNRGAEVLGKSPQLSSLNHLVLSNTGIESRGAKALAESPYLINLKQLDLSHNKITIEGIRTLGESPYLENLTDLYLENSLVGPEGSRAIAESRYLKNLQYLNLSGTEIGDRGVLTLCTSKNFDKLQILDLSNNEISNSGAIELSHWPQLKNLEFLILNGNDIGAAGVAALQNSPYLNGVEIIF